MDAYLDYSEGMTAEEQKRYINYLAERVRQDDLEKRAMKLVMQDFLDQKKADEERLSKLDEVLSRMDSLEESLKDEIRKRKNAERKVADLTARLKFADKNRFGDKSQKSKKSESSKNEKSDRNQDKDDFDGTPSSLPGNSIGNGMLEETPEVAPTEKKRDLSKRPETYNTMGVQSTAREYKSDLGKVPGRILNRRMVPVFHLEMNLVEERFEMVQYVEKGKKHLDKLVSVLKEVALEKDSIVNCDETWCKVRKYDHYKKCYIWVLVNKLQRTVIFFYEDGSRGRDVFTDFIGDAELKSVMSDGYNAYVFIDDELKTTDDKANFKSTEHQVCLSHARTKFKKALDQAGDRNAEIFIKYIGDLYDLEHQYTAEGLTDAERGRERQGLRTKEILISLRQHLNIAKAKDPATTTPYLTAAINYLDKFWNNIFAYVKNGSYPIDNNIAERNIRHLTTQRNSMLHFGSDEGAEMAATYHSIISTVKMHGRSAWEFLGKFFTKIFNGCRDFVSLRPDKIGLAICQ